MSSAPFKLITSTPGDTDVVSQFPVLDRNDKDIVQSWMNTDHNVDGSHTKVTLVAVGTLLSDGTTTTVAPTPTSARTAIYRDTDGAVKTIRGEDSTVEFLGGVPPGFVGYTASATIPQGWLLCDGRSAGILRSTYARLFTAIGTLYGVGDGSTTFNLPDLQGRVVIGKDGASRVTVAGGNFDASVLSGTGGVQNKVIAIANVPALTFAGTPMTTTTAVNVPNGGSTALELGNGTGGTGNTVWHAGTLGIVTTASFTPAGTVNNGSANTAIGLVQPAIVLNPIIRT